MPSGESPKGCQDSIGNAGNSDPAQHVEWKVQAKKHSRPTDDCAQPQREPAKQAHSTEHQAEANRRENGLVIARKR